MSSGDTASVEAALVAGAAARDGLQRMAPYQRAAVLWQLAASIRRRSEEAAQLISSEVSKPIRAAREEVARALDTVELAAEEARRPPGQWQSLAIGPRSAGCEAIVRRFPLGLLSFITPFNFPLNLAIHKLAPAIAAGCPWILKPAPQAPRTARWLAERLSETDLPSGAWAILPVPIEAAGPLVRDERIALLSFTGSARVGWELRQQAGRKQVLLELGGNAACVVDEGVDLEHAAGRITAGAYGYAGQSCISVQRIFAHRSLYAALTQQIAVRAAALRVGPPSDEATELGPLIDEAAAMRVEAWVDEALAGGAVRVCGGPRVAAFYPATLLRDVPRSARVVCEEVFGPVAVIEPFDDFAAALERVNDSRYGLQVGIFTRNLEHAWQAWETLEVGGVLVNEVPTFRVDSMPYGGVKESGLGREGVAAAIESYTTPRLLVLRRADVR